MRNLRNAVFRSKIYRDLGIPKFPVTVAYPSLPAIPVDILFLRDRMKIVTGVGR